MADKISNLDALMNILRYAKDSEETYEYIGDGFAFDSGFDDEEFDVDLELTCYLDSLYSNIYDLTKSNSNIATLSDLASSDKDQSLIIIQNTKDVSSKDLMSLPDDIKILVKGPFDTEKSAVLSKPSLVQNCVNCSTYSKNELLQIVEQMETIETAFNENETDLQKVAHIYAILANAISYDSFKEESSKNDYSLRGLITGKSTCGGYSRIFKELLERQGIECHFALGRQDNNYFENPTHAWNIVTIEGKNYPVDLTWDSSSLHLDGNQSILKYFSPDIASFDKNHIISLDDPSGNLELSSFTEEQLLEMKPILNMYGLEISVPNNLVTMSSNGQIIKPNSKLDNQVAEKSDTYNLPISNIVASTERTHTTSSEISSAENEVENSLSKNDKSHSVDE